MATLRLDQVYVPSSTEKVVEMERELERELAELTSELEENEMHLGIAPRVTSTVPLPKDIAHYKRERAQVVQRALQVSEAQPLRLQAEEMRLEMAAAECNEYTTQSLPLLLHQYFLERIQSLVQSKHLHMLRWRRFCEHTSAIEHLFPHYNQRLTLLMSEYHDCVQRAQRLAAVREAYLAGKGETVVQSVTMEDLLIYLRWLVCHMHAMKRFNQFLRVLQWLPVSHKMDVAPPDENAGEEEISNASKIASRYQDESTFSMPDPDSRPTSAVVREKTSSPIPPPPPINLALLTTTPLPSSSMIYAAAATGGGLASDEQSLCLPVHDSEFEALRPQLAFLLNLYGINYDLNSIHSTADEMEMFAAVNRKFKHFFVKQEHLLAFRMYDRIEGGSEGWGTELSNNALLKDSTWLPFVTLTPKHDPHQEKRWTDLRQADKVDEILRVMSHFLKVKDAEKVQDTLKEHAGVVHNPPTVQAASVTSHRTPSNTRDTWRKIYTNPDLYTSSETDEKAAFQDIDERDVENVNFHAQGRGSRRRRDSYDYVNTVQMLGLDDGEQNENDPVTVHGSFLTFLHLRHLRIRDLQRTCLSVLNYFRSIERTLTINDGGLSMEGNAARRNSPQNHRRNTEADGTVGGGGGLGSHAYLHNTPVDFKISETEFMEFGDVENHDDFYTVDEGRVHVQDQRGFYIMYDCAVDDLKNLEKDLLLMATHFIEKDREFRLSKLRAPDSSRPRRTDAGDFDIPSYAHQDVDRFGVLLDIWTNEAAFLERKRELLDCYYEAYQHVTDRDERRALAQTMTNVMYRRPRFDFQASYFVRTYRTECSIVQLEARLVKSVLDRQIEEQREYTQRVCREGEALFGLPSRVIPKQPIAVNLSRPALRNVYMMEFHPTLAIASRIPEALQYANWELQQVHRPETTHDALLLEKQLLEVAQKEWNTLPHLGKSYSTQLDKDLFSGIYVEDPLFMCELAQHLVTQQDQQAGTRRSHKERQIGMLDAVGRVMETVTLRHRLIDAAWECEILSNVYIKQGKDMGYDAAHLNLRLVQFEYASHRPSANKPPPIFITAIQDNDSSVDKYNPAHRNLAIHELDESHVGRFSFRTREGLLQVLRPGGMESLQVVLKAQIVHKNALTSAVLQASACQPVRQHQVGRSGRASPTETKSEKSSVTQLTGVSTATGPISLSARHQQSSVKTRNAPEAFMSLQLEKTPSRDMMLNDFVAKKSNMGAVLRNPEELEKLKRKHISEYCDRFHVRMSHTSLRAQILAYYGSMLSLLEDFPSVRDTYFMMGEPNEKKTEEDSTDGLVPDPRTLKKRPRRLLSHDGRHVLNLWFIPHYTEVLIMFKHLDDDNCYRALAFSLSIVSSIHDMLQYLCAFSRLGSSHARLGSRRMEFVSADWGGTEGIGSELRELQKHVDALADPTDPTTVQELLWLRRDVMFLEFDTAVRHCMTDTFLSTGNMQAFKSINVNMRQALSALSNVQRPSLLATYLTIPEPLEARDPTARNLFPWRTFLGTNGPFPTMFWQWTQIVHNIQLCLAGLRDVDRHVANGEILGVTLLMEDVLQMGYQGATIHPDTREHSQSESRTESRASHAHSTTPDLKDAAKMLAQAGSKGLHRSQQPMEAYRLLKFFLLLWKCVELCKTDWGKRKMNVESISTTNHYREFCKHYRVEMLVPVLQSVARRLGQGEMYDAIIPETDVLAMPRGASEIEVRAKQLVRLFEALECHMITEVRKRVSKELTLCLAERAREESALPTDLWKRAVMKESFTTNRPHIAEQFVDQLMSQAAETESEITFSRNHLSECLASLGRSIMGREKQNYESYTMYYENLLRTHHQLLYQSEQEVKQLKEQLLDAQQATVVEVQCQMAARAYDLIMEITALRAKILEMRELSMTHEQDIRERVKKEFKDVIQNMFGAHFQLRTRFDEFKEELRDDVFAKIHETRGEAVAAMSKLAEKFGGSSDDELRVNLSRAEQLRALQQENHQLSTLIIKMKAMHAWRDNHMTNNHLKTISELRKDSETGKKEMLEVRMLAEEQVILLRQQLIAIKQQLAATERESNKVRRHLDKELKIKQEKEHELMQKERSKQQLEAAKQASIERLVGELNEKDIRLRTMVEEQDRNSKMQSMTQEKVRKDVDTIKKQLTHERSLKLDAFHRVDELQSQVYDYETSLFGHNQYASPPAIMPSTPSVKSRSRANSAGTTRRPPTVRPSTTSGIWPPQTSWPANRGLVPLEDGASSDSVMLNNLDYKKILRPKSVGGRLRSRIAEQLLNELEPDPHRTIVQLEQLQLEGRR